MLDADIRRFFDPVNHEAALIQRGQVHKLRNILDHLPERERPSTQTVIRRAYQAADIKTATRLLTELAKRLERDHPSARCTLQGNAREHRETWHNAPETQRRTGTAGHVVAFRG